MTKKHFIKIAGILNEYYQEMIWPNDKINFNILVSEFVCMFTEENKFFKSDVFINAVYKSKGE